jgi:hypothetical protein
LAAGQLKQQSWRRRWCADEAAVILAPRGFALAVTLPYSVASVTIRRLCAVNARPRGRRTQRL